MTRSRKSRKRKERLEAGSKRASEKLKQCTYTHLEQGRPPKGSVWDACLSAPRKSFVPTGRVPKLASWDLRAENIFCICILSQFDLVDSIESCSVQEEEEWFDEKEDRKRWCCKTE
jgi:hypothetical protein